MQNKAMVFIYIYIQNKAMVFIYIQNKAMVYMKVCVFARASCIYEV